MTPIVKKIGKWLILIALLTYVVYMGVWASAKYDSRPVKSIEVDIAHDRTFGDSLTRRGVIAELARFDKNLLHKTSANLNLRGIERYLTTFPNFESVECTLTPEGYLRIYVVPMIPELRVFEGDRSYYINKDGKQIESAARFFGDVPVVSGRFGNGIRQVDLIPIWHKLEKDKRTQGLFTMIKVDDANNIILIPRMQGHVVNIGDRFDLDSKLNRLMLAYKEIMPYKGWNAYDTISVKFKGQIVATRADKTIKNHIPVFEEDTDYDEASLQAAGEQEIAAGHQSEPSKAAEKAKAEPEKKKEDKPKADKPKTDKPKTDKPKADKPKAESNNKKEAKPSKDKAKEQSKTTN